MSELHSIISAETQERESMELAFVVEMLTANPKYYHADEKEPRLKRAQQWVRDGKVRALGQDRYEVEGSKPGTSYTLHGEQCTCENATKGKSRVCYHAVAVRLYQEWRRRLTPPQAIHLCTEPAFPSGPKQPDGTCAHPVTSNMDGVSRCAVHTQMVEAQYLEESPMPATTAEMPTTDAPLQGNPFPDTPPTKPRQEPPAPTLGRDDSAPLPEASPSGMLRSTYLGQLIPALVQAQVAMKNPRFDATNPHFKMRYASLAAVRDAVTPVLAQHGLAVTQLLTSTDGRICCETILWHTSGQYLGSTLSLPVGKNEAQSYGAASTYARRYGLMALCNVVGDTDDDGEDPAPLPSKAQAQAARDYVAEIDAVLRRAGRDSDAIAAYWEKMCVRCKVEEVEDIPPHYLPKFLAEVQAHAAKLAQEAPVG